MKTDLRAGTHASDGGFIFVCVFFVYYWVCTHFRQGWELRGSYCASFSLRSPARKFYQCCSLLPPPETHSVNLFRQSYVFNYILFTCCHVFMNSTCLDFTFLTLCPLTVQWFDRNSASFINDFSDKCKQRCLLSSYLSEKAFHKATSIHCNHDAAIFLIARPPLHSGNIEYTPDLFT